MVVATYAQPDTFCGNVTSSWPVPSTVTRAPDVPLTSVPLSDTLANRLPLVLAAGCAAVSPARTVAADADAPVADRAATAATATVAARDSRRGRPFM